MTIANALAEKGLRVVGVPKTIDNDLDETVVTLVLIPRQLCVECLDGFIPPRQSPAHHGGGSDGLCGGSRWKGVEAQRM
jgi:hypothetical protein